MASDDTSDILGAPEANVVIFDYIKANDFRVVWADGAIGGVIPQRIVHMALYSERPAIARRQVYKLEQISDDTGRLGDELYDRRISRNSIVREMACDVFLSERSAEILGQWLLERISDLKKQREIEGEQ